MVQCHSIDQLCPSHREVLRFFPPPTSKRGHPYTEKGESKARSGGGRGREGSRERAGGAPQTYVVPLDKGGALLEASRDTDRLELESVDSWLCPSHWRQHIEASQRRREGKGRRWWWRRRRPGKTRALSKELARIALRRPGEGEKQRQLPLAPSASRQAGRATREPTAKSQPFGGTSYREREKGNAPLHACMYACTPYMHTHICRRGAPRCSGKCQHRCRPLPPSRFVLSLSLSFSPNFSPRSGRRRASQADSTTCWPRAPPLAEHAPSWKPAAFNGQTFPDNGEDRCAGSLRALLGCLN